MTKAAGPQRASFFRRYVLPSLALKGVIIGGGYATGRELVEYFLSQQPGGALLAMLMATVIWSVVAAVTFALAYRLQAFEYQSLIAGLLGRGAIVFEVCFIAFAILLLAVFGAAAGEIGASVFGGPVLAGTVALAIAIAVIAGLGEAAVETMFKLVSTFLYAIYALFVVLVLTRFGAPIADVMAEGGISPGWPVAGLTYGSYNIVAAVMILPVLRHLSSTKNAVIAGAIAGPMAMLPALAFTLAMFAFYPAILGETLPSDYILRQIGSAPFRLAFNLMVFGALLESGVGVIHALNERALRWHGRRFPGRAQPRWARPALSVTILIACMFVASSVGLVDLIASGYRLIAWAFIATFIIPLVTLGAFRLARGEAPTTDWPTKEVPHA
jgi:uncharacterized membrane protein YkvI